MTRVLLRLDMSTVYFLGLYPMCKHWLFSSIFIYKALYVMVSCTLLTLQIEIASKSHQNYFYRSVFTLGLDFA